MRKRKKEPEFLTQSEIKALFKVIRSIRDRLIFLTAYRHGLRASEIGLLHKNNLDLEEGTIYLRRLKGSTGGIHPLQEDEVKLFRTYLLNHKSIYLFPSARETPITRFQLHVLMRKYGELAGIPWGKSHFHALKHSIAVHLIDAGSDILFVQAWLGHRSLENTRVYARLTTRRFESLYQQYFQSGWIV